MTLALYRKYRPAVFAEVIGQEHVTEPLQQAIRSGRVHHAYLFSGPRGCGKTSSARILARSLNCAEGPTPTPCGECDSCVALAPGGAGSLDVIEIDAASHGGVDDARDLRERAFFAPVASRYKIYIVDEAHMVTSAGFNALLKVVEEPPPHLKFVFATTEPDKVIPTIRSRTHHYPFRLVPPSVLREYLAGICVREGVDVDPLVPPLVVRAGGGSVRDALSVLDQLIAGAGVGGVTYAEAVALLGYTDAALLDEVVDALAVGDGAALFESVDRAVEAGHDPRRFASDLLERYRDLLLLEAVPDAAEKGLIDAPTDQAERMRAQAARLGRAELSRGADLLHAGLTEMRGTTSPRLLLELLCARLLLPAASEDPASLRVRLERLERRFAAAPPDAAPAAPPAAPPVAMPEPAAARRADSRGRRAKTATSAEHASPVNPPSTEAAAASPAAPPAAPAAAPAGEIDAAAVRRLWPDVLQAVKARARTTHALLMDARVTAVGGRVITLEFPHRFHAQNITEGVNLLTLQDALREVLVGDWKVHTQTSSSPAPASELAPDLSSESLAESTDEPAAADPIALLESGLGARVIGEIDAS